MISLLFLLLAWATGYRLVRWASGWSRWLSLSMGVGVGAGLSSSVYAAWRMAHLPPAVLWLTDVGLLVISGCLWASQRSPRLLKVETDDVTDPPTLTAWWKIALWSGGLGGLLLFGLRWWRDPYGKWDAMAIWNLHARFLYRGGEHWTEYLTPLLSWSHPDYPLLLPALVAHGWQLMGHESPWVPGLLAFGYTFATLGLLVGGLAQLGRPLAGALAGLCLLGSPYWWQLGAAQYADIPLGYGILAVLLCQAYVIQRDTIKPPSEEGGHLPLRRLNRIGWLIGLCTFLPAWTKNEGLIFSLVFIGLWLALAAINHLKRHQPAPLSWTLGLWGLVGALPIITVLIWFKTGYATANDLVAAQNGHNTWLRLSQSTRYLWLGRNLITHLFAFTHGIINPVLLAAVAVLTQKPHPTQADKTIQGLGWAVLAAMMLAYSLAFLTTPSNLDWHIRSALDRLYLQLWPAFIWLSCYNVSLLKMPKFTASPGRGKIRSSKAIHSEPIRKMPLKTNFSSH